MTRLVDVICLTMVPASVSLESGTAIELARFQEPMLMLATRAASIDIRDYEIAESERVAAELQPRVLILLVECRELLASVLRAAEGPTSRSYPPLEEGSTVRESLLPFEHALDAKVARQVGSLREVEELAFIAHLEIREREERLRHTRSIHGSVLLSECDSSLRRIGKALGAVDAAIASAVGMPRQIDFTSELSTSLAVRRAYAKFRGRIHKRGAPRADGLRSHLRALGTEIAIFVGSDVYRDLRVQDRLLLRDLQLRLLTWLRVTDAPPKPGVQLWQDLIACVEMFSMVNRRQELVEHDSRVVRALLRTPVEPSPEGELPKAVLAELRKLEGLDPELDALLHGEVLAAARPYSAVLTRLAERLGLPEASSKPEIVA